VGKKNSNFSRKWFHTYLNSGVIEEIHLRRRGGGKTQKRIYHMSFPPPPKNEEDYPWTKD